MVGGATFGYQMIIGKSAEEAAKSALITGMTTGTAVTLGAAGSRFLTAGSLAFAINASLQIAFYRQVNVVGAILGGFGTSGGAVSLSLTQLRGISLGSLSGFLLVAPSQIFDILAEKYGEYFTLSSSRGEKSSSCENTL